METLQKFIVITLDTRITPLAYLFATLGLIRGLAYTVFQSSAGVQASTLVQIGTIIPLTLWGLIVLGSSVVLLYGLVFKVKEMVMAGAMGMFLTQVLTSITYFFNGYLEFMFPTAIVFALCYGYYFLAAGTERLWDYSPREDYHGRL